MTGSETVPDFSVVRSIGGAGVWSLADVEKAKAANAPADTPVVCQACPLGLRNVAEGNDRVDTPVPTPGGAGWASMAVDPEETGVKHWVAFRDPSGRPFYFTVQSNESTWTLPVAATASGWEVA